MSLPASSLDFGSQASGTPSASQTAVLSNNYFSAFTITALAVSGVNPGDFREADHCPTGVANGFTSSCTITVTFSPTYGGGTPESAKIVISDTANNSPRTNLSDRDAPVSQPGSQFAVASFK